MIYLPKRAVFIHIPRTAGNSITNAIASTCCGNNFDIILGTSGYIENWTQLERHVEAKILRRFIPEWDYIFKFAIWRPEEERMESAKRLIDRDIKNKAYRNPMCPRYWADLLLSKDIGEYWKDFKQKDWDFYTKGDSGEDIGVQKFEFSRLEEDWPEICNKCQIPKCQLPRLNAG